MKYTLLEVVQTVLSSMDSDEINSIEDTVESQQVVEIVKNVYDDIISRGNLNSNKTLFNLVGSTDPTKPILMTRPDGIDRVDWLKYNCQKLADTVPNWVMMQYLPVDTFVDYMHQWNQNLTGIQQFDHLVNGYTIRFTFRNDIAPKYFTSLDDTTLMFDAFDNTVDTTLQSSKTIGYGFKATNFVRLDSFVPELLPQQFQLLINEAKSLAWAELKQVAHTKAEISARRNWRHLQKSRQSIPDDSYSNKVNFDKLPNFSRSNVHL
jgi:hypothetical protein